MAQGSGTRIVVVGGVAAGMSAAAQAKRSRRDAEVIVLERGGWVSYGSCGLTYNLADPARPVEDLIVLTAERARAERGVDVRVRHEVLAVEVEKKRLRVRDLDTGVEEELAWDRLVLATGASAVRPAWPGIDSPGVFVLRDLGDGLALKGWLAAAAPRSAVIVGAGYIGLEAAEMLRARGLGVTVLEKLGQAAPGWEPELGALLGEELGSREVRLETGVTVEAIERAPAGAAGRLAVRTDRGAFAADLVLVAVGVRPNVALARAAGLALGAGGAIAVDEHQATSASDVFAAGDCAEAYHLLLGRPAWVPLGTTSNKQGRVAGANAAGEARSFHGIVGTAGFRAFGIEAARTGLGRADLETLGIDAVTSRSVHPSRGHAFGGGGPITTVVLAERRTGRVLGAQMAGPEGVALRIDVWATALHAGLRLDQVEALDLAYAPPFAPVYDPILVAAAATRRAIEEARQRPAAGGGKEGVPEGAPRPPPEAAPARPAANATRERGGSGDVLLPSVVRERILAEHREIRLVLAELEELAARDEGDGAGARLSDLRRSLYYKLHEHMDLEDAILAPALRAVDAWGELRAEALLRHHEEQRAWLASLLAAVDEPPPTGPALAQFVRGITEVLREDMRQEERDLLRPDLLRDDIVALDLYTG